MNRRELLINLSALPGGMLVAPLTAALEGAPPLAHNPGLSQAEFRLAGLLAEHVIPETDTPGAIGAGVDHFLALMVQDYLPAEDATAYRSGLAALDALAALPALHATARDARFIGLPQTHQIRVLTELDHYVITGRRRDEGIDGIDGIDGAEVGKLAGLWRLHKPLVLTGYYTSEVGATQELRPMPMGQWDADVPYADIGRAWS